MSSFSIKADDQKNIRKLSSAAVFYEQLQANIKNKEQVALAECDRILAMKMGEKKKQVAMTDALAGTEAVRTWNDHKIGIQKLCEKFQTSIQSGLPTEYANQKRKEFGRNILSKKNVIPWYCVFINEITGYFSLLLWLGSLLCFLAYAIREFKDSTNLYLGIVLALIVWINGCFTYAQTSKQAEMMAQFANYIPEEALVLRDNQQQKINAKLIIPGDIVFISQGNNIPCDLIIFKSDELKVNNASLTGESEDILLDPLIEPVDNIFESKNVAFFGTTCTNGNGQGLCFRTGDSTVIGQIANLASSAQTTPTPLSLEIQRFIKIISGFAVIQGIIFFILGILFDYDLITNIVFVIGIIVANVPEGLLATITILLTLTSKRMAQKMVLVKNLQSVETLGSTSCICSDKTGTLTQNKMKVSHIFFDRKSINADVNYEQYQRQQMKQKDENLVLGYDINDNSFTEILKTILLSTNSTFFYEPSESECKQLFARMNKISIKSLYKKKITDEDMMQCKARLLAAEKNMLFMHRNCKGDSSEAALIQFVQPILDLQNTRDKYPIYQYQKDGRDIECMIPFGSDIKFNLFIRSRNSELKQNHKNMNEDNLFVYMKGTPDRIFARCSKILINGKEVNLTDELREEIEKANIEYANLGERVLAFARYKLSSEKYKKGYQFDIQGWKAWGLSSNLNQKDYSHVNGSFPMHNLCLVGIVSLNDPPRANVDISVTKCRQAGIKVIMVTGDQPSTASAIAQKVKIITQPQLEFNYLIRSGLDKEEAWNKCQAIVIHGDLLAEKHLQQDMLDDMDPEKGRFLIDWISKPEVVFAKTSPSQKLLIVDACQKAGHVVAVTGDGVNDSPAIKKADIGIAMGSGSDVAKNAADMLLLDDNFNSIVCGIEEGRLIFDNLKKSIAYTLQSNVPEIIPFIFFIVFQLPLPLSSVLILCIDIGCDLVPAISFAYENSEMNIMQRNPRDSKRDHLVNAKLISFSYLQIGAIQAAAGIFTYFYCLNDFGIRPATLLGLSGIKARLPNNDDIYKTFDDYQVFANGSSLLLSKNGNTNYGNLQVPLQSLQWDSIKHSQIDIRLFYAAERSRNDWTSCRFAANNITFPKFYSYSQISNRPICYSTEALKYAQSSYLVTIVVAQAAGLLSVKTRQLSLYQQGMRNYVGNFGLFFEFVLVAILIYIPPLNKSLGTRMIPFPHFAVPSLSFFVTILFYDELRKLWLRSGFIQDESGKIKLNGWIVQNTYY